MASQGNVCLGPMAVTNQERTLFAGAVSGGANNKLGGTDGTAPVRVYSCALLESKDQEGGAQGTSGDLGAGAGKDKSNTSSGNAMVPASSVVDLQYVAHSASTTRLRVTLDDTFLFSTGEDGCLFIFDIQRNPEFQDAKGRTASDAQSIGANTTQHSGFGSTGGGGRFGGTGMSALALTAGGRGKAGLPGQGDDRDRMLPFADEILVTRSFLDGKQKSLNQLEEQVGELSMQIDFQLSHRDAYHAEKMSELEDRAFELSLHAWELKLQSTTSSTRPHKQIYTNHHHWAHEHRVWPRDPAGAAEVLGSARGEERDGL